MDSREFSEWKAVARYYEPFGDEWRQTGLLAAAMLAPYSRRPPRVTDFMPIHTRPQTPEEAAAEIRRLIEMRGSSWQAPEENPETP